jgi:hypothetical protein
LQAEIILAHQGFGNENVGHHLPVQRIHNGPGKPGSDAKDHEESIYYLNLAPKRVHRPPVANRFFENFPAHDTKFTSSQTDEELFSQCGRSVNAFSV